MWSFGCVIIEMGTASPPWGPLDLKFRPVQSFVIGTCMCAEILMTAAGSLTTRWPPCILDCRHLNQTSAHSAFHELVHALEIRTHATKVTLSPRSQTADPSTDALLRYKIGMSEETPPLPTSFSQSCRDFTQRCLQREPTQRQGRLCILNTMSYNGKSPSILRETLRAASRATDRRLGPNPISRLRRHSFSWDHAGLSGSPAGTHLSLPVKVIEQMPWQGWRSRATGASLRNLA